MPKTGEEQRKDTHRTFVDRLRNSRQEVLRNQYENVLFYLGHQWLAPLPDGRGFMRANLRRDVPRPVTNRYKAILDAIDAPLSRLEPALTCAPGSDKDDDRTTADLANRVLDYLAGVVELDRFKGELSKILVCCNNGYGHLGHDPDAGNKTRIGKWDCETCGTSMAADEADDAGGDCPECAGPLKPSAEKTDTIAEGAMYLEAVTPFEVWLDYAIARMDDQPMVMIRRLRPRLWAEARWPDQAKEIKKLPAVSSTADVGLTYLQSIIRLTPGGSTVGGIGFGAAVRWDEAILDDTLYVKPCVDYPEGLYLRMLGDELILEDRELRELTDDGTEDEPGQPFIPVVHYGYDNVPGVHVHTGPADHLKDLQRQRNRREAAIELYFQRMANGVWLIPEGTDVQTPTGEEGWVMRYSPMGASGAKPERMDGGRLPASFVQWLESIDKQMEDIAGCLDGETKIPCLDGCTRTMRQLAAEYPDGGMWVYGFDREQQRIVPALVEKAWMTGVKRCVKVVLNEGDPIICTFDHPFLTWDRGYVKAEELAIDEAIVPLRTRTRGRQKDGAEYQYVLQPADGSEETVHRMVACGALGLPRGAGRGWHVHHRDRNAANNLPSNLEVLTASEHKRRHWADLPANERGAVAVKRWANTTPEERKVMMAAVRAGWSPEHGDRVSAGHARRRERQAAQRQNHRVVAIVPMDDREVFDLQTSMHNFAAEEVFVHNTYDIFRGEKPPNVSSGYAMQILTERAQSRFAHVFANYEVSHAQLGRMMFLLFRQHAPDELYFKIKGEEARWTVQTIKRADLKGGVDIRVEAGSARPRTTLEKKANAEQAINLGLVDIMDPDVKLRLLNLYGIPELMASAKADDEQVAREHATIIQWASDKTDPQTGAPPALATPEELMLPVLVDPLLDNHTLHLSRHRPWMLSEEYLALPDWVRQAFRDGHFIEHLYEQQMTAMQQAGMPAPQPAPGPGAPQEAGGGAGANAGAARAQGQAQAMASGGAVPGPGQAQGQTMAEGMQGP